MDPALIQSTVLHWKLYGGQYQKKDHLSMSEIWQQSYLELFPSSFAFGGRILTTTLIFKDVWPAVFHPLCDSFSLLLWTRWFTMLIWRKRPLWVPFVLYHFWQVFWNKKNDIHWHITYWFYTSDIVCNTLNVMDRLTLLCGKALGKFGEMQAISHTVKHSCFTNNSFLLIFAHVHLVPQFEQ